MHVGAMTVSGRHLDRLTSTDASFLARESESAHMHVGAMLLFAGAAPELEELRHHIRERLHLVPRYRQKLAFPPPGGGRPLWIDDPDFSLERHVHRVLLAAPGDRTRLPWRRRSPHARWTVAGRSGSCGWWMGSPRRRPTAASASR
jgi:hypothetical protein